MKYFVAINGEKKGPFQLEEVLELNLDEKDLVWHDGMAEWQTADTLPELRDHFDSKESVPPPLPNEFAKNANNEGNKVDNESRQGGDSSKGWRAVPIVFIICAAIAIVSFFSWRNDQMTQQKAQEQIERSESIKQQQEQERLQRKKRIAELKNEYFMLAGLIEECSDRYEKAEKPQLFRFPSEKERQLREIREERNGYLERINPIAAELRSYGVEVKLYYNDD